MVFFRIYYKSGNLVKDIDYNRAYKTYTNTIGNWNILVPLEINSNDFVKVRTTKIMNNLFLYFTIAKIAI
jgi:hypothetical protein